MLSREHAIEMLREHKPEPHLVQHALASEAVLHALAVHLGEDAALWAMTGLVHDIDYPLTQAAPERHGLHGAILLAGLLPEAALAALRAHNCEYTKVTPETKLDFALRCGETVTGLVTTAALVRPTGIDGMEAKSLKKKMKDKAFAASVNREIIKECEQLDMDLDTFLTLAIAAMAAHATTLGLSKG